MVATLDRSAREYGIGDIARADHPPFAALLPYGPVVGDPDDGVILLQEPNNPRDAALGCMWKVQPRNVGAIADEAVMQMAGVLQGLFRSLVPGTAIQVLMHMAPTDEVRRWSDFRKDAPDIYSLNEFQEASIREGLAHAGGAKRWRLRNTTTLVTARLSAPVPDLRRQQRALSLFRSERTLLRHMNRLTETVLAQVLEELAELRVLCESVLDMAGVRHQRLDCTGIHREISRLLQPWQRQPRCYDPEVPMREQLLSVPARTTMQGTWVFGPDEDRPGARPRLAGARHVPATGAAAHLPRHPLQPARAAGHRALRALGGAARHAPDPGDAGRRPRPGGRTRPAAPEAQLRLPAAQHRPGRGRPGEGAAARRPRPHHEGHHLPHPAHARAPGAVGQGRPLHGLDRLGADPIGAAPGPGVPAGGHPRPPALPAIAAPRPQPEVPQGPHAQALTAHLVAGGGAPATAVRRLHRQRDAGAALCQPARRSGHLRPVRRHHRRPHHRGGQVAFRQILPGQPSHSTSAAPGQLGGHSRPLGVLRHHLRGVQGRVRRDRPRQAGVLQPVRRRPGIRAPHLSDGAHRPDGLRGVRPGCGRPGADRQGGVLAGIASVRRVAPGKPARRRAAAQGLLRPAAPPAVRGRRAGGGHRAAHRPVRRQGRVRRLRGRPERTAAEQQPGRLRAGQSSTRPKTCNRCCCSP